MILKGINFRSVIQILIIKYSRMQQNLYGKVNLLLIALLIDIHHYWRFYCFQIRFGLNLVRLCCICYIIFSKSAHHFWLNSIYWSYIKFYQRATCQQNWIALGFLEDYYRYLLPFGVGPQHWRNNPLTHSNLQMLGHMLGKIESTKCTIVV